jgi:hypothetical protein
MSTPFVPPFGGSSVLENQLQLASAGPAPGVPVIQEIYPGRIQWVPLNAYGFTAYQAGTLIDDAYWGNWAANYLLQKYGSNAGYASGGGGGVIEAGPFPYNLMTQLTLPEHLNGTQWKTAITPVSLRGIRGATVLYQYGSTGIWKHRYGWGNQNSDPDFMGMGGQLRDFTLDGQHAPVGAIGIDLGDMWGPACEDVTVRNFTDPTGTLMSSIGFYQVNRGVPEGSFGGGWLEKMSLRIHSINNDNHYVVDTLPAGNISHEYNDLNLFMYVLGGASTTSGLGQNGVIFQNGSFQGGGKFNVHGNHGGGGNAQSGTNNMISFIGNDGSGHSSMMFNTEIDVVVEGNGSSNLPSMLYLGGANNQMLGHGQIVAQFGGWSPSVLNGGTFGVAGRVANDSVLTLAVNPYAGIPVSGQTITYQGIDAMLFISGGTGVSVLYNGLSVSPVPTSLILRNGTVLKISWTTVPSFTCIALTE